MKITIYALHLGVGGVEKYVSTLANILVTEHEVEIVSTYRIQEQPAFELSPKVKVTYLMEKRKPNKEELKDAVQKKNIFRILSEGYKAFSVLILKYMLNKRSIKKCKSDVIISTRIFHNKLIGKYADKDIVKITGEHNHHNNNQKYIDEVVESCKNFDYFIPISRELSQFYDKLMKNNGVKTKYIRFCIDDNHDHLKPEFKNNSLITIGRFSEEKGIYDLIDIMSEIHKCDASVVLNIIGDGPEYTQVCNMIKERNLQDVIKLHGFRDKEYIYKVLPQMSLYLMTSFTESFGIVLLEAMSCGIPCIAFSSAQGAHEIIEDDVNGYLIENRDKKLMVNKIITLLNDRNKLMELSASCLNTAEKYSYENTKKSWLAFMRTIEEEEKYD